MLVSISRKEATRREERLVTASDGFPLVTELSIDTGLRSLLLT